MIRIDDFYDSLFVDYIFNGNNEKEILLKEDISYRVKENIPIGYYEKYISFDNEKINLAIGIYYMKKNINHKKIIEIFENLKNEIGCYYLSVHYYLSGKYDKSKEYLRKIENTTNEQLDLKIKNLKTKINSKVEQFLINNLIDYESILQQYVDGDESLFDLIFEQVENVFIPLTKFNEDEIILKYIEKNDKLKASYYYNNVRVVDSRKIEQIKDPDVKNYLLATKFYVSEDSETAIKYVYKITKQNDALKFFKAQIYVELNEFEQALTLLNSIDDKNEQIEKYMAFSFFKQQKYLEAAEFFIKARMYETALIAYKYITDKDIVLKLEELYKLYPCNECAVIISEIYAEKNNSEKSAEWLKLAL